MCEARHALIAIAFAGCGDKDDTDTSADGVDCGSMAVFVSGTVSGPGAPDATVRAHGDAEVAMDWSEADGDVLHYELNLPAGGTWSIHASVGDCEGEPFRLLAASCSEHVVDLEVACDERPSPPSIHSAYVQDTSPRRSATEASPVE